MDKNHVAVGAREVCVVVCDDPLAKAAFLDMAISGTAYETTYVDFDLMYSGHVASGILQGSSSVDLVVPEHDGVRAAMSEVMVRASRGRRLVIIDSLNGMRRMCNNDMAVNSALMMLASVARNAGSSILISCSARRDYNGTWVLSQPPGRITRLGGLESRIHVGYKGGRIKISVLDGVRQD